METPLPTGITAVFLPSHTDLVDAAQRARDEGLHLITNGRDSILSRTIPPGWHKVAVRVKEAA